MVIPPKVNYFDEIASRVGKIDIAFIERRTIWRKMAQ